ncbi:MAG: hypothetical protein CEN90_358 [Parcubacteria group bacterium Licking1014_17]|nr:MAG: hypothetical protein CEN90_358 [Parcubacteria group bacterium Licking1014_17]
MVDIKIPGCKRFVAKDTFGPRNSDGIKFSLENNFEENFLDLIEEDIGPAEIILGSITRPSLSYEIMDELSPEKRIIKLAHFYEFVKIQPKGWGGLLAYIEDRRGIPWAVHARWGLLHRWWRVRAISIVHPRYAGLGPGCIILSHK